MHLAVLQCFDIEEAETLTVVQSTQRDPEKNSNMRMDDGGWGGVMLAMQGWGGFQNVGWRAAAATEDCGLGDKHRHADSPEIFPNP